MIPPRLRELLTGPRLRKVLPWVGYPAFYLFALFLFSYVTAPYEQLRHALMSGFNSADAPLRLQLDELSWSWRFPGISGSGGRLVGTAPPEGKKTAAEYPIEDFYVRLSILPLLVGTTSASFGLDAFGGSVAGSFSDGSDELSLETELSEIDAAELPYLAEMVGLPMTGKMVGDLDLTVPEKQLSKAEGALSLDIEELTIGDGQTKIRGTIALPPLQAGLCTLSATIEEGRVTIEEFSAKGPDLELVADGKIRLLDRLETSLVEMDLRFKFSDAYKQKSDTTKALFGAPDSKVPGIFDLDPKMKQAKREDGFYVWRVTGPLNRLNFQPGESSPTTERKKAARRPSKLRSLAARRRKAAAAARQAPAAEPAPAPAPVMPPIPTPMTPPAFQPPPPPVVAPAVPEPPPAPPEEEEEVEEEVEEEAAPEPAPEGEEEAEEPAEEGAEGEAEEAVEEGEEG